VGGLALDYPRAEQRDYRRLIIMDTNSAERLSRAKAQLLIEQQFFGNCCLSIKYVEVDESKLATMGVDGLNCYYNPKFVAEIDDNELKGVLLHEILHLIFDHLGRRKQDYIPFIWNVATDYKVNSTIVSAGMYKLPKGALYDSQYNGDTAEIVYDKLMEEAEDEVKNKAEGGEGDFRDFHGDTNTEETQAVKEMVVKSYEALSSTERGNVPAEVKRIIQEIKEPKVNWREFIRATITDVFQRTDFSFARGNRNYIRHGLWLPSLTGEENKTIVIAVDTSGSITPDILSDFAAETSSLLALADKSYVLSCDATVHEVADLNKYSDILKEAKFSGGGGTSFSPVFDKVNQLGLNPDVLVYLTDGYGSFPESAPNYPVIWGIIKDSYERANNTTKNIQAPFGQVLNID